ncbi:unnamed protein product [Symbiodinium natans]|uniref:Uncharacterized protein n=1 Tax=Symbiodinium natans TaxID=878477 RepID=A0A812U5A4_9DINO|nr:unnamed protein product [Symbiodinium natans]
MNQKPILVRSWSEHDPYKTCAFWYYIRQGYWICASRILDEDAANPWQDLTVWASGEGEVLPRGKIYSPWNGEILPCWSQGVCGALSEVFELVGNRDQQEISVLKDKNEQLELEIHALRLEARNGRP